MSQAAMCMAVRDKLQTVFGLDADSCEVGFDGQPKPACGELYVAVHPLSWSGISGDWDLGEEYGVGVTLTMRMGVAPKDRWGIAVWLLEEGGMEQRIRQTRAAIHHNQEVRIAANAFLGEGGGGFMLTPLQILRVDPPKVQGPSWFSADPPQSDKHVAECGVSQMLTFGKCQRVQSIPDME